MSLHGSEVELDQLLVELGALLAERVDDVFEIPHAHTRADSLEMGHRRVSRKGLDLLQIGHKDLGMSASPVQQAKVRTSSPALWSTSKIHSELSKMRSR